ncbi:Myb-like DNA-binding domain containing protein [Trichomonas vaginalis G3]|uniref:Myb-like DNA-binding domain containing protein n=1 Tax=Trichomonas vaginalis (strain ATCC PRA-98 / G3) TaxID=412133 RepID=A2FCU3_TRIV3|nr:RNA polymerase II transcription regulator recruiting protein [Trichomonas vaginalis G3]EAX97274.1 Myb-like DNA-binding domain containing protein [Trichomonas vaginalis G3]KAI5550762.1 RNA polymerase II transcription regulator recruiting protein [Trichomonas vaginalis G3]|eukprot:XP_001310204.1 Myb-like DNA-binding domain containing protein [Trichomonas vaginalis G3]
MSDDRNSVGIKRRRLFSPQDDKRLEQIIREGNFSGWKAVAKSMPGFTPKQLRDRWHNYLSPKNSLAPWSLEEDIIIVQKIKELGTK